MKLTSETYVVTKGFKGKSKFKFWQELKEGDLFRVSTRLKHVGHYTPMFSIYNIETDVSFTDTHNSFFNYLNKFEFELLEPKL